MTRYRFDNQEKKKSASRTQIIGGVVGVSAVVLLVVFVIAPFIRNVFRGPAWLGQVAARSAGMTVSSLTPKKVLLAKNAELEEKVASYEAQMLELQMLRQDNAKLRTELSYVADPSSVIGAQVLAKPNQSLFNRILIDRGSSHGISVGQVVVAQGTIGLGRVIDVSATTATVELFSGPQFVGDMLVTNQDITVPAKGKGSGNFEIHIPREIKVSDGDLLALPEYPGLTVGVVKSIIFDARDPFQTVIARIPVNVQELRFVEVLK